MAIGLIPTGRAILRVCGWTRRKPRSCVTSSPGMGTRGHAAWAQKAPAAARHHLVPGTPNLELRSAARLADKPNLYGPGVREPDAHRAGAHARLGAAAGRSKRVQPAPYGPDRVDRGRPRADACRPGPVRSGAGAVGV